MVAASLGRNVGREDALKAGRESVSLVVLDTPDTGPSVGRSLTANLRCIIDVTDSAQGGGGTTPQGMPNQGL